MTPRPRGSRGSRIITGNVPGSQNVRNTIAQRYKNPAGQLHAYQSASRHDQGDAGPAESGAGGGRRGFTTEVTVLNRFVWSLTAA